MPFAAASLMSQQSHRSPEAKPRLSSPPAAPSGRAMGKNTKVSIKQHPLVAGCGRVNRISCKQDICPAAIPTTARVMTAANWTKRRSPFIGLNPNGFRFGLNWPATKKRPDPAHSNEEQNNARCTGESAQRAQRAGRPLYCAATAFRNGKSAERSMSLSSEFVHKADSVS